MSPFDPQRKCGPAAPQRASCCCWYCIEGPAGGHMRVAAALLASAFICAPLQIVTAIAAEIPPRWAYPENNPAYKPPADDGKPVRVPDSTAGYTWGQLRDRFIAPVWHADDPP